MNPVLRELGFSPEDRVVVVHADDIGMFQSTIPAIHELSSVGIVTSASAMVPCRWFDEVVSWWKTNQGFDVGVHLTLTSEWEHHRWQPLEHDDGLIDDHGFLHKSRKDVVDNVSPSIARKEMTAQVDFARDSGLSLSHIDSHMFVALSPDYLQEYLQLGFDRQLVPFLPRIHGSSVPDRDSFRKCADQWESKCLPVFDCYQVATKSNSTDRIGQVKDTFNQLPPGLSCVLLHPAMDSREIRNSTNDWQSRVADYEAFRSQTLRDYVNSLGIQLISFRPLLEAMQLRLQKVTNCS